MHIIHISTECYPAVKNGGLADVIGALPKYLIKNEITPKVIIPYVNNRFTQSQELTNVFESSFPFGEKELQFKVLKNTSLEFDLYFIKITDFFDKTEIYGNENDTKRFLSFQIAVLEWLKHLEEKIDILHCHDHNTGLIPFFIKYADPFEKLSKISTVFTIHNIKYQGVMPVENMNLFPKFNSYHTSLVIWNEMINSTASGIQCADKIITVSPNYLNELCINSSGLEYLFQTNRLKCSGILNGIDDIIWNPETDPVLVENYVPGKVEKGKLSNKKFLCDHFKFDEKAPLFSYIGKLTSDKGGDLLETLIQECIDKELQGNFIIMGQGNTEILEKLKQLQSTFPNRIMVIPELDEKLGHLIFAGSDFYLMPSKQEPCGLGQMYAMRYGTIPIVSNAGGLEDTVINFDKKNGYGIKFSYYSIDDIYFSIVKAEKIFQDKGLLHLLRKRTMNLNFSWNKQTKKYIDLYNKIKYELLI